MNTWNNLTIGKKQAVGFGAVLLLLIILVISSYNGIGSIVFNAKEVITGNQLDGMLAQKEVDHLNWANKVNALLTDEKITTLNAETDHTRCDLGKWLHSEDRREAEKLVPELSALLEQLERPHEAIHKSAININQTFRKTHKGLVLKLSNRLIDHLKWVSAMAQEIAEEAGGLYSYQNKLKNSTEALMSIIKIVAENEHLGDIPTRKKIVLDMVNKIRYGDKNDGYYWINDLNRVMVLHPIKPQLKGKDLSNFKDPKGKHIFREFVDICQQKTNGFSCYYWPYPGKEDPVPKISYV
ncbi:Methyl-accepting chemotaxis sensory transducer, partial [Candidatus Magnetomorum sp. HK-1]